MIDLWKTGDVWYPDNEDIKDKPVRYSIASLIEIASRTGRVKLTEEHERNVLGEMSNFIVKDGILQADKPNVDYKGKGFSPVFNFDLIEHEDHYEPTNIVMENIGLTKTPRSHIVYNSIANPNGDREMENDVQLRQALDDNRKLQEEIGVLKNQNKTLNASLKEKKDELKSLKDEYSANDKKLEEYDDLLEIKKKYDGLISSKKDDLIYQLVGDDKDKADKLKDYSIDQLEFQIELAKGDEPPKGVTPQDTHTDDGNDPTPQDGDGDTDSKIDDMAKAYEEMYGEKPNI